MNVKNKGDKTPIKKEELIKEIERLKRKESRRSCSLLSAAGDSGCG